MSDAESDADAVALFRPRRVEALKPFLDLDDESEESEGIYAEALEDGSFLLHTFQPFALFAESDDVAHTWLEQFGEARGEVHDDPRGILFFPDSIEPEVSTYAGVVEEAGEEGVWVAVEPELDANALAAAGGEGAGAGRGEGAPRPDPTTITVEAESPPPSSKQR